MGVHPKDIAGNKDFLLCFINFANDIQCAYYYFYTNTHLICLDTSDDDVASILEQMSRLHPSAQDTGMQKHLDGQKFVCNSI